MMFKHRNPKSVEKARKRAAEIASIDFNLDLGHGLTVPAYQQLIESTQQKFDAYNTALAQLIWLYNEAIAADNLLADWNTRMMSGVVTRFGKNSIEYKLAGGKQKQNKSSGNSKPEQPSTEETKAEQSQVETQSETTPSIDPTGSQESEFVAAVTSQPEATKVASRNGSKSHK
jgi:hypothetical protein